jgi:hypothetical protein
MEVADKGHEGALTSQDLVENSEAEAIRSLLASVDVAPELPGLVSDAADEFDVLGKLAENINAKRRGAGRPSGSANKRNDEMFDYLEARGFKAPELRKMELISADPFELARTLLMASAYGPPGLPSPALILRIIEMQDKSANDMLPYKFAKKHEVKGEIKHLVAHVMMAGRLTDPSQGQAVEFSLTGETVDNQ